MNFAIHAMNILFQDLLDDWSSKSPQDLLYFVPYAWKFNLTLKKFEAFVPTNEFNWLDTTSANVDNSHMGLCGKLLNVRFELPYTEFLPNTVPFHFDITVSMILLLFSYVHSIFISLSPRLENSSHPRLAYFQRNGLVNLIRILTF